MALLFHDTELLELMQDFHILTGMRLVLFDENCHELVAYPEGWDMFCACLRKNPAFDCKCRASDASAFAHCRRTRALHIYKCHAGFVEATAPIIESGRIIGYLMFGQITDNSDRDALTAQLAALCREYGIGDDLTEQMKRIKYRDERQIRAASKIMDACTGYVRLREIVHPSGRRLIDSIEQYIDEHLAEEISVARLCEEFYISRTRLYELVGRQINGGVAAFVRRRRLEHAKKLILEGKMSIPEIADTVGFSDYNYFLRVFRQEFGISPRRFAKSCLEE